MSGEEQALNDLVEFFHGETSEASIPVAVGESGESSVVIGSTGVGIAKTDDVMHMTTNDGPDSGPLVEGNGSILVCSNPICAVGHRAVGKSKNAVAAVIELNSEASVVIGSLFGATEDALGQATSPEYDTARTRQEQLRSAQEAHKSAGGRITPKGTATGGTPQTRGSVHGNLRPERTARDAFKRVPIRVGPLQVVMDTVDFTQSVHNAIQNPEQAGEEIAGSGGRIIGGATAAGAAGKLASPLLLGGPPGWITYIVIVAGAGAVGAAGGGRAGKSAGRRYDERNQVPAPDVYKGPPPMCFVAGTLIHTPIGLRTIEELVPGQVVVACNHNNHGQYPITNLFRGHTEELIDLLLDTDEIITTTPKHRFFVDGIGWICAEELHERTFLRTVSIRPTLVRRISHRVARCNVFNFEVQTAHNYYVGATGVLTHNMSLKHTGIPNNPTLLQK